MKKTPIAAAAVLAGLLMAACGGMHTAGMVSAPSSSPSPSPPDAITSLERACLLDPMNAANWARLATALEADGQRERAARFYQQAATLAAHDARRDYALLAGAAGAVPAAATAAAADPSAAMPRTEVQQIGAAMVQVVRVAPPPMAARAAPPVVALSESAVPAGAVRLEISNGNGVTGAAANLARVARTLDLEAITTVRLTNARPFNVPRTRIEYPHAQRAVAEALAQRLDISLKVRRDAAPRDVRIVLGHDGGRPK